MNTASFKITNRYRKLKQGYIVRRIIGCGKSLREQQNLEYMLRKTKLKQNNNNNNEDDKAS